LPYGTLPLEVQMIQPVGSFDQWIPGAHAGPGQAHAVMGHAKTYVLTRQRVNAFVCLWRFPRDKGVSRTRDKSHESIAPPGNGLNVFLTIDTIPECLTQVENIAREVSFFDKNTGPHFLEKLFFCDDVSGALYQRNQDFQVFGGKRNSLAIALEDSLRGVEQPGAKTV